MPYPAFVLNVLWQADLRCELIRVDGGPEVYLVLDIVDPHGVEFDRHRPPIVWCDGRVGIDLANSRSASDLLAKSGLKSTYTANERRITTMIWAGEGPCPAIDSILRSSTITIRVFTRSYDIIDVSASPPETARLVERLRHALSLEN